MVRLRDSWCFSLSSAPTVGNPCRPLQPETVSDPRSRCEPDPYRLASLAAVRREAPSRDAQYRACRPGTLGRVYSARRTALRASAVKNSKGSSEREAPGEGPDPRLTCDERTRHRHGELSGVARA